MTEQLGRRAALVLLVSMMMSLAAGLLAWGPITLDARAHVYADTRPWFGLPNAFNVLVNLLLLLTAAWGWCAARNSAVSPTVRRAWQGFQLFVGAGAVTSAIYHLRPGDTLYLLSHFAMVGSFAMLSAGMLAERIHPRFGASVVLALTTVVVAAMTLVFPLTVGNTGDIDIRPLLLLETLPVLLIPAGALSLPGDQTRTADWMVMLLAFAAAKGFELSDRWIFDATGWISGHSLMHLALAFVAGWLGYCAAKAPGKPGGVTSIERRTSLYTAS